MFLPRIFRVEGFRHRGVAIDAMHCVDLGVALHIIGNIFFEVVHRRQLGRTHAESVKALWRDLGAWYKEQRVPYRSGGLKFEDFRQTSKAPKFRGKFAITRHLSPYLVKPCTQFNEGTQHDQI